MSKTNESFLEILNSYFSNLKEEQVVAGRKENITIPMEWIFNEKIDRKLMEKAFVNLICRANKSYRPKLKADKDFYGKVSFLEIERTDSGVNLVIRARDGWTKIVVTGDKNLRGPFYAIGEDTLYEEVQKVYDLKSVGQVCEEFNLSMEEREKFMAQLKNPERKQSRKETVISEMAKAAENLINYYDYMSKKKMKYDALSGAIQQRKDKRNRGAIKGNIRSPRKSDIYDFKDREQILQEMNPSNIINIDKIEDDNSVTKFAYVTYVYQNPRGRQGYLFIAEPFEGTHNTRVRFVSQEEFNTKPTIHGRNKLVYIAESITEMSNDEFESSKFSKQFKHTSIEKYREKFRRVVLGEQIENSSEETRYAETDKIIFEGATRRSKNNIRHLIKDVTITDIASARTALYARGKGEIGEVQIVQ